MSFSRHLARWEHSSRWHNWHDRFCFCFHFNLWFNDFLLCQKLLVNCFKFLYTVLILLVNNSKVLSHFLDFIKQRNILLVASLIRLSSYFQTQSFVPHVSECLVGLQLFEPFLDNRFDLLVVARFDREICHTCLKLWETSLHVLQRIMHSVFDFFP